MWRQGSGDEEAAIPRIRLTKSAIDGLPVLLKDAVYWDAGLPGFGVKVTPQGRKVFLVLYRLAGAGSRLRKYRRPVWKDYAAGAKDLCGQA
jgi:hypothetical protein